MRRVAENHGVLVPDASDICRVDCDNTDCDMYIRCLIIVGKSKTLVANYFLKFAEIQLLISMESTNNLFARHSILEFTNKTPTEKKKCDKFSIYMGTVTMDGVEMTTSTTFEEGDVVTIR